MSSISDPNCYHPLVLQTTRKKRNTHLKCSNAKIKNSTSFTNSSFGSRLRSTVLCRRSSITVRWLRIACFSEHCVLEKINQRELKPWLRGKWRHCPLDSVAYLLPKCCCFVLRQSFLPSWSIKLLRFRKFAPIEISFAPCDTWRWLRPWTI